MPFSGMGHPYAGIVQSGLFDLLDGAKLSRPVRHSLETVLVSCLPIFSRGSLEHMIRPASDGLISSVKRHLCLNPMNA